MTTFSYACPISPCLALLALAGLTACSKPAEVETTARSSGPAKTTSKSGDEAPKPSEEAPEPPESAGATPDEPAPPSGPVPFSLKLEGATIDGFDGLHSAAGAMHEGKLVLMSGRRNGMHAFPPERKATKIQAFPRTEANETIYVLDPKTSRLLGSAGIDGLPDRYQDQLRATNTQYATRDGWLYIVGGYTYAGESMKTLDVVTAIELGALVDAVSGGKPLDESFAKAHMAQGTHLALAVTGGELLDFGGHFLLVFGNKFDGLYTPGQSVGVQTYSQSVRAFDIGLTVADGSASLGVNFLGSDPAVGTQQDPDGPYHRRDGSVEHAMDTSGKPRIAAYGGVFKGGKMEGYTAPVYIDADASQPLGFSLDVDEGATQLLSQYKCGLIQAFDGDSVMYTTFFGGISQYHWNASAKKLERDPVDIAKGIDGLPFIDSVSTMRLNSGDGGKTVTAQYLHDDQTFPPADAQPQCTGRDGMPVAAPLLGAETQFFRAPDAPAYDNGVLRLDQIDTSTVVGYLVGGIAATAPYGIDGPTCASGRIYTVTLDPTIATKTTKFEAP